MQKTFSMSDLQQVQTIVNSADTAQGKIKKIKRYKGYYAEGKLALAYNKILYALAIRTGDLGAFGKHFEGTIRIFRICSVLGRKIRLSDCWARPSSLPDMRIKNQTIEIKTGHSCSDFHVARYNNLADELRRLVRLKKILIWATTDFQIVLPYKELVVELEKYPLGTETFFFLDSEGILRTQNYQTSKEKTIFLQEIARKSYSLKALLTNGELVRR